MLQIRFTNGDEQAVCEGAINRTQVRKPKVPNRPALHVGGVPQMTLRPSSPRRLFEGHESSAVRSDSDGSVEDGTAMANKSSSNALELGLPASTSPATLRSPSPCKDGETKERCPMPPRPCTGHARALLPASSEDTISYGFPRRRRHALRCGRLLHRSASAQVRGSQGCLWGGPPA
jgi:hypothetical protein